MVPGGRRAEPDLELLDNGLLGFAVLVRFLVIQRHIELVLGVLFVFLALLLLVHVVDHCDRLGRRPLSASRTSTTVPSPAPNRSAESVETEPTDAPRRRVHRADSARGTGRERLQRRSSEDEHTGPATPIQHERGAGGGERPFPWGAQRRRRPPRPR